LNCTGNLTGKLPAQKIDKKLKKVLNGGERKIKKNEFKNQETDSYGRDKRPEIGQLSGVTTSEAP